MTPPPDVPSRPAPDPTAAHRSGFACLVGRPNTGKSTLLNALVGAKVAITSDKPQTTRRAVRGIITRPDAQLVIVDTPGLHKPRTLLGERLDDVVRSAWSDVDVVGMCVPADEDIGPGDRRIAAELARQRPDVVVVGIVTKTDLARPERIAAQLLALSRLRDFADLVPVSARAHDQVDLLAGVLIGHLPTGPRWYPEGELTDEPVEVRIAELIREAALAGARDELPHSVAVLVDEIVPRAGTGLVDVYATIYVERDSQKAIVIGRGGSRLAAVGRTSRAGIEQLLGGKVFLSLHVTVAKDWQRDPKKLATLGFAE